MHPKALHSSKWSTKSRIHRTSPMLVLQQQATLKLPLSPWRTTSWSTIPTNLSRNRILIPQMRRSKWISGKASQLHRLCLLSRRKSRWQILRRRLLRRIHKIQSWKSWNCKSHNTLWRKIECRALKVHNQIEINNKSSSGQIDHRRKGLIQKSRCRYRCRALGQKQRYSQARVVHNHIERVSDTSRSQTKAMKSSNLGPSTKDLRLEVAVGRAQIGLARWNQE